MQDQKHRVYNRQDVEKLSSNQFGVYGLFKEGVWIYIGKGDIRQRLLDHLNGDNPYITLAQPDHWVAELTPNADAREKELIREYNPVCNKRVG